MTESGRNKAMKIYERHTILSCYLEEVLNISHDTAENDACKMEHILSEETFNKIKEIVKNSQQ